ncbi:MAG TPA: TonB-dependent receptor [Rhodanobacteraceae bacterium]
MKKCRSTLLGAAILGALAASGVTYGQTVTPPSSTGTGTPSPNKKPRTLSTVVVTGSHISGAQLATDTPVIKISSQAIQATGKQTIGDVIARLPQIAGGLQTTTENPNDGAGDTRVGLRGLGPSRTLILVNGERVLNSDLNTIPTIAVQSIEVLPAGASAIYGSEAIGGVINIILKSHFNGAEFTGNMGISDHGDAQRHGYGFIFGHATNKGSLLAGVSYQKQDPLFANSRRFSRNSVTEEGTKNGMPIFGFAGTVFAARDNITVPQDLAARFGCTSSGNLSLNSSVFAAGTSPTTPADYHCYTPQDGLSNTLDMLLMTPQERTNAFLSGSYKISDHVSFYATYYHDKTAADLSVPPAVFGTQVVPPGPFISKDNVFNPFGVDFTASNGNQYLSSLVSLGARVNSFNNTTDQLNTGFRGAFAMLQHQWRWNVGLDYGHQSTVESFNNYPNVPALTAGLGPSMFINGVATCVSKPEDATSAIAGCTPWDPFNLNAPSTIAALKKNTSPALTDNWSLERVWHASINGGVLSLPAGTLRLALGLQYRKEYTNNSIGSALLIDPTTLTCALGSFCSGHMQGGFDVKTAYTEVFVPVLKDLPGAHRLALDLADRYSKYSDFGSTNNWKIGVDWRPISDLLVRGTVTKVFRAPTISDLFASPTSSAPTINSDPCDGITVANPACVGVPLTGKFVNAEQGVSNDIEGVGEGAKTAGFPIGPERGKSFDFGVVYSPRQVKGLTASVDFWRIYLDNVITPFISGQTVLDECFNGATQYCPLIHRIQSGAAAGEISHMILPTGNLGRLDVKGTDLSVNYALPRLSFGQFDVALAMTYMDQYKIQTAPGTAANAVINGAGLLGTLGTGLDSACPGGTLQCFLPRVRGTLNVSWRKGVWGAEWRMRYSSKFNTADVPQGGTPLFNKYGAYVYNDVSGSVDIRPINTTVSVGIDNVFDKQPPILGINRAVDVNTDPEDFDVIGRYFWAKATVAF